jgi:oligosaccharide repeat unit polymerase
MKGVAILALWWLFWTGVSVFAGIRLDPVSDSVILLVFMFTTSLFVGAIVQKCESPKAPSIRLDYTVFSRVSVVILCSLFILQLPVWFALVEGLAEIGSISANRHMIFYGDSLTKYEKLIFGFSSALFYNYALAASIVFLHQYKDRKFLIVTVLYLLVSAVLKGSRAEIYQFIGVSVIYFYCVYGMALLNVIREHMIFVLFAFLASVSLLLLVSYMRGHNFIDGFIDYHVVGFVLLTKYVNGLSSAFAQEFNYGVSYFGGLDYLVGLVGKMFFFNDLQSASQSSMVLEGDFRPTFTLEARTGYELVEYSQSGHNAFYTLLLSGYKSFGVFGVSLQGLVLGFFISRAADSARKLYTPSAFYLVILISCVFMGIFSSALDTPGFWLSLILFNFSFQCSFYFSKN